MLQLQGLFFEIFKTPTPTYFTQSRLIHENLKLELDSKHLIRKTVSTG